MRRSRVRNRLGPPERASHRIDRWCLIGKGELRVAYGRRGAQAILTSGRGQGYRGVARGDRLRRAHRRLDITALEAARVLAQRCSRSVAPAAERSGSARSSAASAG